MDSESSYFSLILQIHTKTQLHSCCVLQEELKAGVGSVPEGGGTLPELSSVYISLLCC